MKKFFTNKKAFILVKETFFVETDTIGWYQSYIVRQYLENDKDNDPSKLFMQKFSIKDKRILLSYLFAFCLFLSFLGSKKLANATVGIIGMSNGTVYKKNTKGTFSLFYNFYWYEPLNNYIRYGRTTVSKVYPSLSTNSRQANPFNFNSKEDIFILFQTVNSALLNLNKSNLIRKNFSIPSLNISSFKNQTEFKPSYSQIKRITSTSISLSFLEIIGKEVKKLLLTYVILDSVRIIGKKDFEPEMNNVQPVLSVEAEEEKAFEKFLVDSGIDITTLSPKELKRLKNKWRNWRYGLKSLVSFMKYLWYLLFKKVKSFRRFLREFIKKNYSHLILFLKVILSISIILLLYQFYLKMLHILLLSQLKNVTKDFEKKLFAIVEENKSLQRLVENCELTNKQKIQLLTYQLYELKKRYQPFIDQILNRT